MTQNTSVGYIPVPTTRTVNSKALSSDISLTASDVGAQPSDVTLTALSGLTTAANKLPYATGEDTFDVCDFTPLGRSLIGTTTTSAVRDLIASASSTTAALSILVYDGTPSAGDLTTYDEIYTTPALCFAALPAIINHAVTIKIREADGSAYAAATLQRVVSAGSITIEGEFYKNGTIASAGSTVGKFNVQAGDTGAASGDKVLMMKYSGTVGSSTPSDAFFDTVSGVSGTEITLTTRTTDAFDTSWRYVIVRTECAGITATFTNNLSINGLYFVSNSDSGAVAFSNAQNNVLNSCIVVHSGRLAIIANVANDTNTFSNYVGINHTYTGTIDRSVLITGGGNVGFYNLCVLSQGTGSSNSDSPRGMIVIDLNSYGQVRYGYLHGAGDGNTDGITVCNTSIGAAMYTILDGADATHKIKIAFNAFMGGKILVTSCTLGENITTQKSPANWAATTDGSYIS